MAHLITDLLVVRKLAKIADALIRCCGSQCRDVFFHVYGTCKLRRASEELEVWDVHKAKWCFPTEMSDAQRSVFENTFRMVPCSVRFDVFDITNALV